MRLMTRPEPDEVLVRAAQRVVDAVVDDEHRHGGLLSRSTLRVVDELRVLLLQAKSDEG